MRNRLVSSFVRLIERESSLVGGSASKVTQARTLHSCVGTSLVSKLSGVNFESNRSNGDIPWRSPVSAGRAFSTSAWDNILYPETELQVGSPAPDFSLEAVVDGDMKTVNLSDYKGKYVILFWYPKDFTFVCPTEIIAFSDRAKEFEELNCQLLAASTDTPEVHLAWIKTPRTMGGLGYMQIPILADVTKSVAARYGVLKEDAGIALRGLYIINPEGVVEHATINNFPIGRSVDEALRTLQAIQHVAEHGEVCPAGWKPGDKAMVADPEKSLDYFQTAEASHADEISSNAVKPIENPKELEELIQSGEKILVKFWAPWCGKCRQLAPFVEDLASNLSGKVRVVSVDTTDENLEIFCSELGVKGLPAFRFYSGGKEDESLRLMGYKKQLLQDNLTKFA
ncbi:hypothetical protein M9434_003593 [Picochlorum sp. BPE23]|nr:hypothetical protein M9434_003593 [Picochlorum sp. BPE23]KAI8113167.1 hypothetical protein M9435_003172 [Picochlorum sp. BPE23]